MRSVKPVAAHFEQFQLVQRDPRGYHFVMGAVEKQEKRWTYEEYYRLDDDQRYEIIHGCLLREPSPNTAHQKWVANLFRIVDEHVRRHEAGQVFFAPLDVVLDQENTVQPDLVFVGTANLAIIQPRALFGTPDLVAEVISPSSVRRDRYDKKNLYQQFRVKEYWLADPANYSLEILTLQDGRYELLSHAEEKGALTSLALPGLQFNLAALD